MKYTIYINQKELSKTDFDLVDGAILDYLYFICNSTNEKIEEQSSNDDSFMSIGDWLITFLICAIPIIGIIMMFVWAFGNTNPQSKKTWAQAALIFSLIVTVLYAFIMFAILM